jgi:dolichol-phosphate mannosyltransferase
MNYPLVSVITPLWNEADGIAALSAALATLFKTPVIRWQWVAVDDGSSDHTVEQVKAAMRGFSNAKLVCLSKNFGQQGAYRAGLEHADGDAVVFLDADLQDPPELIPEMIARWRDGAKLVTGRRRSRPERGARGLLLRLFHQLFRRLTHGVMPADSGTFGLMDRVVTNQLRTLPERNLFLPALRSWLGYRHDIIWYDRRERDGAPKQTYAKLFNYAWDGITSFSEVPLRMISWLGLTLCAGGLLYALTLTVERALQWLGFLQDLRVLGFTTLAVGILFLGGVQLLCLGVIGEYLARIYREVKQRPVFIIEKVVEFNERNSGDA